MLKSALDLIKPLAGRALERALNRVLALDPETQHSLSRLEGLRIAIRLESPPLAIRIQIREHALCVGPIPMEEIPDLAVKTTFAGLVSPLLRRLSKTAALIPRLSQGIGQLHFSGDAALAQHLQRLIEQFDPDWKEPFTRVFGDVVGVFLADQIYLAFQQAKHRVHHLAQSCADHITEESRTAVSSAELDAFSEDVTQLENATDAFFSRMAATYRAEGQR